MSEPRAVLVARLDKAVADIIMAYRQIGYVALLARSEGESLRLVAADGFHDVQAKLLYHAADAMADRAFDAATSKTKH